MSVHLVAGDSFAEHPAERQSLGLTSRTAVVRTCMPGGGGGPAVSRAPIPIAIPSPRNNLRASVSLTFVSPSRERRHARFGPPPEIFPKIAIVSVVSPDGSVSGYEPVPLTETSAVLERTGESMRSMMYQLRASSR